MPAGFWDDIAVKLGERFVKGELTEGIEEAVLAAGQQLRTFFPRAADDLNELSDDIDVSDG